MADRNGRALVLGGGGISGIAWELGLLAGLAKAGVNLREAELIIGTSAGSIAGAQVAAGLDLEARYQAQLEPAHAELSASLSLWTIIRVLFAMLSAGAPEKFRRRVGKLALRAKTVSEATRLRVIESRLPTRDWPARPLKIAAIDTATGALQLFDRDSGIPLVQALAASCAVPGVWPAVTWKGRRYMDGGIRSATNADLAAGFERVVVIAPSVRGIGPVTRAATEIAALQKTSKVTLITPDRAALKAFGRNVLDPGTRADSARSGWRQAADVSDAVRAVWDAPA